MRLFLVRHASTGETGRLLTGRRPGVSLSAEGIELAEQRARTVADVGIHALYTSPITRCAETAAVLGRSSGVPPEVMVDLVEVDYGSWSGRRLDALRGLKAWQHLMSAPARFRFPEGETLLEAQTRVVGAIEGMAARHRKRRVVAVSHADVIRVALAHYLGMPLDLVFRLEVRPLSVSIIDLPGPGATAAVPLLNAGDDLRAWA